MFTVKVFNNEETLVAKFRVKTIAQAAPGNMVAQYPALGKFIDFSEVYGATVYQYTDGTVTVQG